MFATRSDLLARSNARRLAQLAVPSDVAMPPGDALRIAIAGGVLAGYTAEEQSAIALALDAIDKALVDASELIVSYGIPAATQTTLLARLCSTIALYYLQGAERMSKDVQDAYDTALDALKRHSRGEMSLIPADPAAPALPEDQVLFVSEARRYGAAAGAVPPGGW